MDSSLSSISIVEQYSDSDNEEPPTRRRKVEQTGTTKDCLKKFLELMIKNPVVNDQPYDSDEDEVDPDLKEKYCRQIRQSDGFDVDITIPDDSFIVTKCKNQNIYHSLIGMSARVGLHWYNIEKGSNFQLSRVEKFNSILCGFADYITLEAKDPSNNSSCVTFQTYVIRDDENKKDEEFCIKAEGCRIKPQIQGTGEKTQGWDDDGVDKAYKRNFPKWYSDDALMPSSRQFYQVQDSEIRENDWLNMYAEISLYYLRGGEWSKTMFESFLPLKIKKVVVQTYEEDVESKEKLKAGNAIFFISFKNSTGPVQEDYRAIVERTVDGLPGHVRLGFKCWLME